MTCQLDIRGDAQRKAYYRINYGDLWTNGNAWQFLNVSGVHNDIYKLQRIHWFVKVNKKTFSDFKWHCLLRDFLY